MKTLLAVMGIKYIIPLIWFAVGCVCIGFVFPLIGRGVWVILWAAWLGLTETEKDSR